MDNKNILVTAATGNIGAPLVHALGKKQMEFKAATRDAQKAKKQLGSHVDTVHLDFADPQTFKPALEGIETLFLCGPSATPGAEDMLVPLAEEAIRQDVKHVVFIAVYQKIMNIIKNSDLKYTFIRANFFMQNFEMYQTEDIRDKNQIFLPTGEGKAPFIHTRDIGEVVAEIIANPGNFENKQVYLTGPEAMDHFEASKIFSDVLGRKIEYKNPDDDTYRKEMLNRGFKKEYINAMIAVFGKIKSGEVAQTSDSVGQILNRKPISLRQYVEEKKVHFTG